MAAIDVDLSYEISTIIGGGFSDDETTDRIVDLVYERVEEALDGIELLPISNRRMTKYLTGWHRGRRMLMHDLRRALLGTEEETT